MGKILVTIGESRETAEQVISILKELKLEARLFEGTDLSHSELRESTIIIIGGQNFPGKYIRCFSKHPEKRKTELEECRLRITDAYLEAGELFAVKIPVSGMPYKDEELGGLRVALELKVGYVDEEAAAKRKQALKERKRERARDKKREKIENSNMGRSW